jgi:hypothetical protein
VESVASIIDSVDTPLGLLALVILGFFALAWKFGKEIITALREIRVEQTATKTQLDDTKTQIDHVSNSIITNHGSKNIGDAIDRLTGWFMDSETERAENTQLLQLVARRLDDHITESEPLKAQLLALAAERTSRA